MVAPGSGGMVAAARRKRQDPAAFREKLVRLMPYLLPMLDYLAGAE